MKEVRKIPNVRKVAMSPWGDEDIGAAEIKGDSVYSRKPNIIWHSDPVKADETVMVQGDSFTEDCIIELYRLENSDSKAPLNLKLDKQKGLVTVKPVVRNSGNLMFVLPEAWPQSAIACRIRQGDHSSRTVLINAPDPWWVQGDLGLDGAPGGWLRVFGKCLNFGGQSCVLLRKEDGKEVILPAAEANCYALRVQLPRSLAEGKYNVLIHNGLGGGYAWKDGGSFIVRQAAKWKQDIFNVTDFGAQPYKDDDDSTNAIKAAIKKAEANGGGIVYFPCGRYRVTDTLNVPAFVTLKGEGMGLVNLFWPDRPAPLLSLILGKQSFVVEDLTIYTQGEHYNVITGEDNTRVQRVRIRAYWLYKLIEKGHEFHGRRVEHNPQGAGLYLTGRNIVVTDCDILHSGVALMLHRLEGGLICRNTLSSTCYSTVSLSNRSMIYEHNESIGGIAIALHACWWGLNLYDANVSKNIYCADNRMIRYYQCDREIFTTDGQGTAYVGQIKEARAKQVELAKDPAWRTEGRAAMADWKGSMLYCLKNKDTCDATRLVTLEDPASAPKTGATLYIVGGKGAGQYRKLTGCNGRVFEIERPWDVEPDETSIVSIARYNGRHIIVRNQFEDDGAMQLYPANYECVVAENHARRCGNFMSWGLLTYNEKVFGGMTADVSWYNQFLDNVVEEGNGWGGGNTGDSLMGSVDGETVLNIYAINTEPDCPLAAGRCQVVRRHIAENNSAIRIDGSVEGGLVENCVIRNNFYGIEVKSSPSNDTIAYWHVKGKKEFLNTPANILLRHNRFEKVGKAYTGNALDQARIIDA